jgi:hypothetical protein
MGIVTFTVLLKLAVLEELFKKMVKQILVPELIVVDIVSTQKRQMLYVPHVQTEHNVGCPFQHPQRLLLPRHLYLHLPRQPHLPDILVKVNVLRVQEQAQDVMQMNTVMYTHVVQIRMDALLEKKMVCVM